MNSTPKSRKEAYRNLSNCTCLARSEHTPGTRIEKRHEEETGRVARHLRAWADEWNVQHVEVDEQHGKSGKTPDVRLTWQDGQRTTVIAEIKEIVRPYCAFVCKRDGVYFSLCREKGETAVQEHRKRVVNKLNKAGPQLRQEASRGIPTIMVVGHWTPVLDGGLDFDIIGAMMGGEYRIREDTEGQLHRLIVPGVTREKAWNETNRSISGVALVSGPWYGKQHDRPELYLYRHNNPRAGIPAELRGVRYVNLVRDGRTG